MNEEWENKSVNWFSSWTKTSPILIKGYRKMRSRENDDVILHLNESVTCDDMFVIIFMFVVVSNQAVGIWC